MIIYMNKTNQIKILECMKKAANSYIKIKIFERLVKYVDEINKIKKFGIHDWIIIMISQNMKTKIKDI